MLMLTTPSVKTRNLLATAFLLAMAFCNLTLFCRRIPSLRNGYQDFTIFYTVRASGKATRLIFTRTTILRRIV